MRVKLQLVLCPDDSQEETVTDVAALQTDCQRIEHLGLTFREVKQLLHTIQKRLLHHRIDAFLDAYSTCPNCGVPLNGKGDHRRSLYPVFGTFALRSLWHFPCCCRRRTMTPFSPLTPLLPESGAPELLVMPLFGSTRYPEIIPDILTTRGEDSCNAYRHRCLPL
jgi:hypothetical protein